MPDGSKPSLTDGQTSFSIDYLVSNNGNYNFKVMDVAGNIKEITYVVDNINDTPPTIKINDYQETPTTKIDC